MFHVECRPADTVLPSFDVYLHLRILVFGRQLSTNGCRHLYKSFHYVSYANSPGYTILRARGARTWVFGVVGVLPRSLHVGPQRARAFGRDDRVRNGGRGGGGSGEKERLVFLSSRPEGPIFSDVRAARMLAPEWRDHGKL
jgi:hypothetical protein